LARLCVSLADTKHTISSTPAPSARFRTSRIGYERRDARLLTAAQRGEYFVRIRELRHRARAHERRRLDLPHTGSDERVDDLRLYRSGNLRGLRLGSRRACPLR
jgi:hypothetical protein